jgi:hypothetical protein
MSSLFMPFEPNRFHAISPTSAYTRRMLVLLKLPASGKVAVLPIKVILYWSQKQAAVGCRGAAWLKFWWRKTTWK